MGEGGGGSRRSDPERGVRWSLQSHTSVVGWGWGMQKVEDHCSI